MPRPVRLATFLWLLTATASASVTPAYAQAPPAPDPAPAPEPVERELERQQGTWQVVSSIRDGQEGDPEIVASIRRIVTADHVVWERNAKPFSGGTLVLIPATDPAGIDIIPDGGPARGKRVLGIYKFDNDRLILCMADADQPRPTTFSAERASRQTLMTFKKRPDEPRKPRKRPPPASEDDPAAADAGA